MNGRMAKKLRREARQMANKRDEKIVPELKDFINKLGFLDRLRCAGRIIVGRF